MMPGRNRARLVLAAAASVAGLAATYSANADVQYWDTNGTDAGFGLGAGTWNTTTPNWNDSTGVGTPTTWVQGNDAHFQSAGNTVHLGESIQAGAITHATFSMTYTPINFPDSTFQFNSLTVPTAGVQITLQGGLVGDPVNGDLNIISNSAALIANNVAIGKLGTNGNTFTGDVNLMGTGGGTTSQSRLAFLINTVDSVPDTATF